MLLIKITMGSVTFTKSVYIYVLYIYVSIFDILSFDLGFTMYWTIHGDGTICYNGVHDVGVSNSNPLINAHETKTL